MQTKTKLTDVTNSLQAEVIFGLLSKKCKGRGICRIITDEDRSLAYSTCGKAEVRIEWTTTDRIRFCIKKNSMSTYTKETHFNSSFFRMEEDFDFPKQTIVRLGQQQYRIRAGYYRIRETDDNYLIVF
ncbi:MAG: hypothetical protein AAGI23_16090 [Bacteroidota bacterium]